MHSILHRCSQRQAGPTQPRVPPRTAGQTCVLDPGQGAGMTTPQPPVPTPSHPARFSRVLPGLVVSRWRWTVSGGPQGTGPTPFRTWGPDPCSKALGGPRLCRGAGLTHGLRSSPSAVGRADGQSKMVLKSVVRAGSAAASRAARVGPGSRWCSRARAEGGRLDSEPLAEAARDCRSPGPGTVLRPHRHPHWAR